MQPFYLSNIFISVADPITWTPLFIFSTAAIESYTYLLNIYGALEIVSAIIIILCFPYMIHHILKVR